MQDEKIIVDKELFEKMINRIDALQEQLTEVEDKLYYTCGLVESIAEKHHII